MTRRPFTPELHDPILTEMNVKWRRTDQEIADEMGFDKQTIYKHRLRLGLPMNTRPRLPGSAKAEPAVPLPKDKPNPLQIAARWLGGRLVEKPSGFWLDGTPANLDTVMRATNAVLKAHGIEQLGVEKWRVK